MRYLPNQRIIQITNGHYGIGKILSSQAKVTFASATWTTANRAIYVPFKTDRRLVVDGMFWANGGTVTGNVDIGIYDKAGVLLVSSGSTAQSGASTMQYVDMDFIMVPGTYYLGMVASGGAYLRTNPAIVVLQTCGMAQELSAFPLPATATPVAISVAQLPVMGIRVQVD